MNHFTAYRTIMQSKTYLQKPLQITYLIACSDSVLQLNYYPTKVQTCVYAIIQNMSDN